ncbi:NAD(P)/FAD-dependent oxidoreductase [Gramella sp. GC03-9]|uniref:NAD(P)/FAD-dependent oxidoreductase n=1 Tax=Christiangramia oceanisediminis TaxID=2920386 RepID=A0A9X2KY26_9FLAO|nr:NAD(P)/FAD-dependent oxidoreductase [Gramella oceanisediminis]MCP9200420.1 NAD(P)/FAD-dependent oxidoreductase [Gramella oceanisediminis]
MKKTQVIIIGGGLAGLTAAIHLSKMRLEVILIEKENYPKHKVCGEYLSNEVLPYFESLGICFRDIPIPEISRMEFSNNDGQSLFYDLELGGMGISRHFLDHQLYKKALENGCEIIKDTVTRVEFANQEFLVTTQQEVQIKSDFVLGAFGKRSNLDKMLDRKFIDHHSGWLAVKAHYSNDHHPENLVSLHNFNGGYCGISATETGRLNVCYLASYRSFKNFKNPESYREKVLMANPKLKEFFINSENAFDRELSIAQVSFEKKDLIKEHVLMLGDAAGLIHPLCGNGMAMAVHSAKLASEKILKYYSEPVMDRKNVENEYMKNWNSNFKDRLRTGRILQKILLNQSLSGLSLQLLTYFPGLMPQIIKRTHGDPIYV